MWGQFLWLRIVVLEFAHNMLTPGIILFWSTAFTDLILSIDVSSSSGKIAFGILKNCKAKDYELPMPGRSSRRSLIQYLHLH